MKAILTADVRTNGSRDAADTDACRRHISWECGSCCGCLVTKRLVAFLFILVVACRLSALAYN